MRDGRRLAGVVTFGPVCSSATELVAEHRLPEPGRDVWAVGAERDLVWPDHPVWLELDGDRHHRTPLQRAEDRARDREATLAGWIALRCDWWDLTTHEARTADELHRA